MIPPDRWHRIKELLDRALAIDAKDWPQFLEAECGTDTDLRAEVESLLGHDDQGGEFLDRPAVDFLGSERHESWLGRTLGHFTVTKQLATGGMGQVYLAEQQVPLSRTVAIKRIRPGMGTERFLARFDLERQALALMNHPNVAHVYDAGTTETGEPYVVMEYVAGEPITRYCDAARLSLANRIRLFEQVCQGVEHAHQKGVIHSDLKPGNVLVTMDHDGRPNPKVIDFGVARLTASDRDSAPPEDESGGLWFGSPPYASPEQVIGDDDIDTRSDVYSLGALLYELLGGVPAIDRDRLDHADPAERRRLLLEEDPDPPSTRVVSGKHDIDAARLARSLRGDLDSIALKALSRDRAARYATVAELRHDLGRYQDHQLVLAMPPGRGYRLKKFARRNAVAVGAGVLVAAVLVAATVGTSLGFVRAVEAERIAVSEAEKTRQVSDFLVEIFRITDPRQAQGRTLTAREVVDNGVRQLQSGLADAPEVEAAMLDTIGTVYMQLGLFDEARPLLDKGLSLRQRTLGKTHPDYAASLRSLGLLEYYTGAFDIAEQRHRAALAINEVAFGPEHSRVAVNLHNIGSAVDQQGRWAEAEKIMHESLALRRRLVDEDDEHVATTLNNLGGVLRRQGKPDDAWALYEEALAVRRSIGHTSHPDTATVINNLGVVQLERGKLDEAAALHDEALAMQREVLGPSHPATLTTLTNLASVLVRQRRYEEAEPLLRQSVQLHKTAWGTAHINTAQTLNSLGTALHQSGQSEASIEVFDEAIDVFRASVGLKHPLGSLARTNKANALVAVGRAEEAESIARAAAADLATAGLASSHPLSSLASSVLGAAIAAQGRYAEAEPLMVESLSVIEKTFGAQSARTDELLSRLSRMYEGWGKPELSAQYASRLFVDPD